MPLRNASLFLISFLLLGSFSLRAQVSINSPYSRFGIGLLTSPLNANFYGIGGASVAKFDQGNINFANPAFFSSLTETTFQGSAMAKQSLLSTSEGTSAFTGGQIGEIGVGFKRNGGKWGFAMGLNPESSVGYRYSSTTAVNDTVNTKNSFEGTGGVNKLQMGLGRTFVLFRDSLTRSSHTLSIGGTMDYRFGSIVQIDRIDFQNTTMYNSKITNRKSLSDANFTLGIHYALPLSRRVLNNKITRSTWLHLGLTYEAQNTVHLTIQDLRQSTKYVSGVEYAVMTVIDSTYTNFSYVIPQRLNAGFSIDHELKNSGRIGLSCSFASQRWVQLSSKNGVIQASNQTFHDSRDLRIGLDYTPNTMGGENTIFGRGTYRVGMVVNQSYIGVRGNQLVQQGYSAGIQLPARSSKTSTTFSIGFEMGKLSSPGSSGSSESYKTLLIGCNLHPFERWFVQRKYD